MYYLAKFCRICIQTDVTLLDIETVDIDHVKLSEKLEVCAKMVVGRESLSTEICVQCIIKLRISYQFQNMCKKSTKILQGYLTELIGPSKLEPDNFISSDLSVSVTPLPNISDRKKRISKGQRCSLLKKLLTQNELPGNQRVEDHNPYDDGGGLRNIINFTRNYDFNHNENRQTPLDKLTEFSKDFFRHDFSQYRDTILCIIENKDLTDSEDDLFDSCDEDDSVDKEVKFEEVVIEPDIEIKHELFYDEEEESTDCLQDCTDIKKEVHDDSSSFNPSDYTNNNSNNAMALLDRLVENYGMGHHRQFSPKSVRCRTRNNPYISPLLRQQFLYRTFRCNRCDRYFKSPGYLKAHETKVHMHPTV